MTALRVNQRVRISSDDGAAVYGRIEEITPANGAGDRVARISYHTSPESQFLLTVFELGGDWFDLNHQKLAIDVVGPV